MSRTRYDAVVVGSGPNGLSAAIVLARAGLATLIVEARDTPGGGARSAQSTLPGFVHDVCSSVHPLGVGSPFFRSLPLGEHGLSWSYSDAELAHALAPGHAVTLRRSIAETAAELGPDADAYRDLVEPFAERFHELAGMVLGPLRLPNAPLLMARFGTHALRSMTALARDRFRQPEAPALLAGIAAHAMLPLDALATASFGLLLAVAGHAVGWPVARGGSQSVTSALLSYFRSLGGELRTGTRVASLAELPSARAYLLDLTPRQIVRIAGRELPGRYRQRLRRFRYGPGVFKMDWALSGPVPWTSPACARACTVHLGGTIEAIAAAEAAVHAGRVAPRPFVLFVQPTIADASRAPAGRHVAWAYCHVPHGSAHDASRAIEAEIERHAPGFRDRALARAMIDTTQLEQYNPNYVGGDINGGLADLRQLFFRPMLRVDPYASPAPNIFICSSSTPPGGGVHGMCGYWAARSALSRVFGVRQLDRIAA